MEGFLGLDYKIKDDPRYVKYIVRLRGAREGRKFEKIIPFHKRTDADWAQFPPPETDSVDTINGIRADPARGMFCLDWDNKDLLLYGSDSKDEYQALEILMTPCNYLHQEYDFDGNSIYDDCRWDLNEQIDYLGNLNFVLYHTEEIFM